MSELLMDNIWWDCPKCKRRWRWATAYANLGGLCLACQDDEKDYNEPFCMYCHDRVSECNPDCPRLEIENLQAENQRLKSLLGRWLVEDDRGPRAVKRVNETAEAIGWNQEEVRDE